MPEALAPCAERLAALMTPQTFHDPSWVVGELGRERFSDSDIEGALTDLCVMRHQRAYQPDEPLTTWWVVPPDGASLPKWRATLAPDAQASPRDACSPETIPTTSTGPVSMQRSFLETIHGETTGILDLRFIRETMTHRIECSTIDDALALIAEREGWNCYVGIARRRLTSDEIAKASADSEGDAINPVKPGGKANLSELAALWVDIDLDQDDIIGHRHEMEIKLEQLPVEPSMIVWSGGGLHAYWLLEEPIDISNGEAVLEVEASLKGLCDFLGADRAATDASRVMRIPGTWNYPNAKKRAAGRVPTECVFYQSDNGRRS